MKAYKIKTWTQSSKELAKYEASFLLFFNFLGNFKFQKRQDFEKHTVENKLCKNKWNLTIPF